MKLKKFTLNSTKNIYNEYQINNCQKQKLLKSSKSKYTENVFINGHKSIWGSFYDLKNKSWGYACLYDEL